MIRRGKVINSFQRSLQSHYIISRNVFTNIIMNKEVEEGLKHKKPIVALESTIISHGMPYPRNLEVAIELENIIRSKGAIPATIAIIDGFPRVGLTQSELELLARPVQGDNKIIKASRRDIAYACANRLHAATTVSSTMILAAKCGIRVFATGGIGGVHRGAETTMDISADLKELSQTPVTVVCSGVKSILDIPKTLEVLEYQGVPVFSYQTNIFPAFFTNNSGCKSPLKANNPLEIARAMVCQDDLNGLNGQGMLVAVPNPSPGDTDHIERSIQQALKEADEQSIHGNEVTPFVLARVKELTGGSSLEANIALVKNNAAVAAEIAREYAPLAQQYFLEQKREKDSKIPAPMNVDRENPQSTQTDAQAECSPVSSSQSIPLRAPVLVFGGAVVDQMMTPLASHPLILRTSNPGQIHYSYGGVGRNIAEGLASLGSCTPYLITAIGNDANGMNLLKDCKDKGINTTFVVQSSSTQHSTAVYSAIHDETGDLVVAIASMNIFQELLTKEMIKQQFQLQNILKSSCELVVMDGNIPVELFATISALCQQVDVPIFFEPTSVHKCLLPINANSLHHIDIMKPNASELCAMMNKCLSNERMSISNRSQITKILSKYSNSDSFTLSENRNVNEFISDMRVIGSGLLSIMNNKSNRPAQEFRKSNRRISGKHILISMGKHGVIWIGPPSVIGKDADVTISDFISSKHIPPSTVLEKEVVNTSGAGDSFCAGLIHSLLPGQGTGPTLASIRAGMNFAEQSLKTLSAVPK